MLDNDGSSYAEQSDILRQHKIRIIGFDNSNSSDVKTMSFRINIICFCAPVSGVRILLSLVSVILHFFSIEESEIISYIWYRLKALENHVLFIPVIRKHNNKLILTKFWDYKH